MLSIILTGHGGFASGMEKAMKQILGEQSQFIAIDFPETSSTALLTSQLEEAIAQLDCEDGIVFLTDLPAQICNYYWKWCWNAKG